jgi:hypothetical protein
MKRLVQHLVAVVDDSRCLDLDSSEDNMVNFRRLMVRCVVVHHEVIDEIWDVMENLRRSGDFTRSSLGECRIPF